MDDPATSAPHQDELPDDEPRKTKKKSLRWRPWLRAFHRDIGYVCVGLTFVYALSGLAVNHIEDWDPNFEQFERTLPLEAPLADDDATAVAQVMTQLGIQETPSDTYRAGDELEIIFEYRELLVDARNQTILDRGREPRFLLRAANWLHLNRGKKAWTIVADGYAGFLLFLAVSGMFMLPGKKGLRGRGLLFVGVGLAIPILYVVLSSAPK